MPGGLDGRQVHIGEHLPVSTHSPFATLGVKPSPAMSTVSIPTWTSTSASSSVRMP